MAHPVAGPVEENGVAAAAGGAPAAVADGAPAPDAAAAVGAGADANVGAAPAAAAAVAPIVAQGGGDDEADEVGDNAPAPAAGVVDHAQVAANPLVLAPVVAAGHGVVVGGDANLADALDAAAAQGVGEPDAALPPAPDAAAAANVGANVGAAAAQPPAAVPADGLGAVVAPALDAVAGGHAQAAGATGAVAEVENPAQVAPAHAAAGDGQGAAPAAAVGAGGGGGVDPAQVAPPPAHVDVADAAAVHAPAHAAAAGDGQGTAPAGGGAAAAPAAAQGAGDGEAEEVDLDVGNLFDDEENVAPAAVAGNPAQAAPAPAPAPVVDALHPAHGVDDDESDREFVMQDTSPFTNFFRLAPTLTYKGEGRFQDNHGGLFKVSNDERGRVKIEYCHSNQTYPVDVTEVAIKFMREIKMISADSREKFLRKISEAAKIIETTKRSADLSECKSEEQLYEYIIHRHFIKNGFIKGSKDGEYYWSIGGSVDAQIRYNVDSRGSGGKASIHSDGEDQVAILRVVMTKAGILNSSEEWRKILAQQSQINSREEFRRVFGESKERDEFERLANLLTRDASRAGLSVEQIQIIHMLRHKGFVSAENCSIKNVTTARDRMSLSRKGKLELEIALDDAVRVSITVDMNKKPSEITSVSVSQMSGDTRQDIPIRDGIKIISAAPNSLSMQRRLPPVRRALPKAMAGFGVQDETPKPATETLSLLQKVYNNDVNFPHKNSGTITSLEDVIAPLFQVTDEEFIRENYAIRDDSRGWGKRLLALAPRDITNLTISAGELQFSVAINYRGVVIDVKANNCGVPIDWAGIDSEQKLNLVQTIKDLAVHYGYKDPAAMRGYRRSSERGEDPEQERKESHSDGRAGRGSERGVEVEGYGSGGGDGVERKEQVPAREKRMTTRMSREELKAVRRELQTPTRGKEIISRKFDPTAGLEAVEEKKKSFGKAYYKRFETDQEVQEREEQSEMLLRPSSRLFDRSFLGEKNLVMSRSEARVFTNFFLTETDTVSSYGDQPILLQDQQGKIYALYRESVAEGVNIKMLFYPDSEALSSNPESGVNVTEVARNAVLSAVAMHPGGIEADVTQEVLQKIRREATKLSAIEGILSRKPTEEEEKFYKDNPFGVMTGEVKSEQRQGNSISGIGTIRTFKSDPQSAITNLRSLRRPPVTAFTEIDFLKGFPKNAGGLTVILLPTDFRHEEKTLGVVTTATPCKYLVINSKGALGLVSQSGDEFEIIARSQKVGGNDRYDQINSKELANLQKHFSLYERLAKNTYYERRSESAALNEILQKYILKNIPADKFSEEGVLFTFPASFGREKISLKITFSEGQNNKIELTGGSIEELATRVEGMIGVKVKVPVIDQRLARRRPEEIVAAEARARESAMGEEDSFSKYSGGRTYADGRDDRGAAAAARMERREGGGGTYAGATRQSTPMGTSDDEMAKALALCAELNSCSIPFSSVRGRSPNTSTKPQSVQRTVGPEASKGDISASH